MKDAQHTPRLDYHSDAMEWNGQHRSVQRIIDTNELSPTTGERRTPRQCQTIAVVPCDTDPDADNLRLFLAAPALVEALDALMRQIDDLDAYSCADVHDQARAALALARGDAS